MRKVKVLFYINTVSFQEEANMKTMPRVPIVKQSKHWVFTINNPLKGDIVFTERMQYVVYGNETGPSGTPHLQGYVCFKRLQRIAGVKKIFPRAHLEVKLGTVSEAVDYCKKDNDFIEFGNIPLSAKQTNLKRWADAKRHAKSGNFDEIPSDMLFRYYHAFKRYHQDNPTKPITLISRRNRWIVAPSGYGKSTYARKRYPDYYDKAPNKWFVGYQDQGTILCDDFGPDQCKYLGWYLKRWADVFPFPMETKGGGKMIRPLRVVVTSQYTPRECFEDPLIVEAILNRFEVIELEHWEVRIKRRAQFQFTEPVSIPAPMDAAIPITNELIDHRLTEQYE